jgi:hypothetical protein
MNGTHEKVVTIWRSLGSDACAHCAASTAPVVNDQLLAREFGKNG